MSGSDVAGPPQAKRRRSLTPLGETEMEVLRALWELNMSNNLSPQEYSRPHHTLSVLAAQSGLPKTTLKLQLEDLYMLKLVVCTTTKILSTSIQQYNLSKEAVDQISQIIALKAA